MQPDETNDLIKRAIIAAGAGNEDRASDLTARLFAGNDANGLYGALVGVAWYGRRAVDALNGDPRVPAPDGGGPWTLDHIRERLTADDPACDAEYEFADRFLTAFCAGDMSATLHLYNELLAGGEARVVRGLAHLVMHVAQATGNAIGHHVDRARWVQ